MDYCQFVINILPKQYVWQELLGKCWHGFLWIEFYYLNIEYICIKLKMPLGSLKWVKKASRKFLKKICIRLDITLAVFGLLSLCFSLNPYRAGHVYARQKKNGPPLPGTSMHVLNGRRLISLLTPKLLFSRSSCLDIIRKTHVQLISLSQIVHNCWNKQIKSQKYRSHLRKHTFSSAILSASPAVTSGFYGPWSL